MAGKKRLGVPTYEVKGDLDDDILEADLIENRGVGAAAAAAAKSASEGARRMSHNARTHGVKDTFLKRPVDAVTDALGVETKAKERRRQGRKTRENTAAFKDSQRAYDQTQAEVREQARRDARAGDPLAQLKIDLELANRNYMDSLRKSGILDQEQTPQKQALKLNDMQRIYGAMMVGSIMKPLQQGVSSESVIKTIGMGASLLLLSPEFRGQLGSYFDSISKTMRERAAGKQQRRDAVVVDKFQRAEAEGKSDQLSNRWLRRMEKVQFAERGHRLPFTTETAAMVEVSLTESAYAELRRPGADRESIMAQYNTARGALNDYIQQDGLSRASVDQVSRVIVGRRLEREPELASVFNQLGHGAFTKTDPTTMTPADGGAPISAWLGDFVTADGKQKISSGRFSLRMPMNVSEHRIGMAETLVGDLSAAKTVGELNDTLSQYVVATAAGNWPDVANEIEDPVARKRFTRARTMFMSMEHDGLSTEERGIAYASAYFDAVAVIERSNPELIKEWASQYGDNWQPRVAERMAFYNEKGHEAYQQRHGGREYTSDRENETPSSPTSVDIEDEDIIDAEIVEDIEDSDPDSPEQSRMGIDWAVEGELVDDDEDDRIIDAELEPDAPELRQARRRRAIEAHTMTDAELDGSGEELASDQILDGATRTSKPGDYSRDIDVQTPSQKYRRARVNQHYNEVETGGIAGIGSDDAQPLQDVDFEMGG